MFRVMNMKRNKLWTYGVAIAIPEAVGVLGGLLTRNGIDNLRKIQQSALTPPAFIFPIVWTVLYGLMGVSLARIWQQPDSSERTKGLGLFLFQLIINFFWIIFFFNMQAFGLSFFWILCLWVLIGLMIRFFYQVDKPAALLQIPYFIWVTFASYLTYEAWRLNR